LWNGGIPASYHPHGQYDFYANFAVTRLGNQAKTQTQLKTKPKQIGKDKEWKGWREERGCGKRE